VTLLVAFLLFVASVLVGLEADTRLVGSRDGTCIATLERNERTRV
jgi:hypothetical protein